MTSHIPDQSGISHELLASLQHLIIDGYNVLFACSPIFGHYKTPEFPRSINRELLIDASRALTLSYPQLMIQLWFDGSEYLETQPTNRFQVLYSGGQGKGRADREMIKSLNTLKAQGSGLRAIVTADKALQRRSRKNGAVILPPKDFGALLLSAPPLAPALAPVI